MSSCIRLLYLTLFAAFFALPASARQAAPDPDALYRQRDDPASAREAAAIWHARLEAHPRDFESAWKLARACYWLGGRGAEAERRRALEQGVAAAQRAIDARPDRPEGYFWKAANMGALAESFGLRQGIRYRGAIKDALETVLRIDPAYGQASADRALGRWYHLVPGLFGGNRKKAEEHLRRSLEYDPHNHASRFFLAETLFALGRDIEAEAELRKVLAAPVNPEWAPEDREFKRKARERLDARPSRKP